MFSTTTDKIVERFVVNRGEDIGLLNEDEFYDASDAFVDHN